MRFPSGLLRPYPYLGFAMLRQLLTLLALITGLAATAAPAEARLLPEQGVQVQLPLENVAGTLALQMASATSRVPEIISQAAPLAAAALERRVPIAQAVWVGIDRARE
jgi:hypothetical protein